MTVSEQQAINWSESEIADLTAKVGKLKASMLNRVLSANFVLIVEGEEDVLAAYRLGLPDGWAATTNAGGALKWLDEHSVLLKGKHAVIWPDADPKGEEHLQQLLKEMKKDFPQSRVLT